MFVDSIGPTDGAWQINPGHPLNVGRLAWWLVTPSNNGQGNWLDLVSGLPATFSGFTSGYGWSSLSNPGGAGSILFPAGGSTTVKNTNILANYGRNKPLTVMGWVLRTTGSVTGVAFASGSFTQVYFTNSNQIRIQIASSNGLGPALSTGVWYHLAATWLSGSTSVLYVNGVQQATVSATDSGSLGTFYIGSNASNSFGGYINDVSIYESILSLSLIQQAYQLGSQGYPGVISKRRRVAYSVPAAVGASLPWGWDESETTPWRRQLREPIQVIPR